jgi:hypothetical protein
MQVSLSLLDEEYDKIWMTLVKFFKVICYFLIFLFPFVSARYLNNGWNYRFEIKNGNFYQRVQGQDTFWLTLLNFVKVKFYVLRIYVSDTNCRMWHKW